MIPQEQSISTNLLQEAINEIMHLRQQNAMMSPRIQMFDDMMLLFKARPDFPSQGIGEDLVWKIKKFLEAPVSKEDLKDPNIEFFNDEQFKR